MHLKVSLASYALLVRLEDVVIIATKYTVHTVGSALGESITIEAT
jgi:hypothetical protein